MTPKNRSRLIVCLVAVAFTLPVESILLEAVATADSQTAVQMWVTGLSTTDLDQAANQVQAYPFSYRREILHALSPERRSEVWRHHIRAYIENHPNLDAGTLPALHAAIALASPETFAGASEATRAQVDTVAGQIVDALGRDEADYLLYRLGPRDGEFNSLEPLRQRLARYVRRAFVALARSGSCNCNLTWGCDNMTTYCADGTGCTVSTSWPACGWLWNEPCDGSCRGGNPGRP